MTTAQVLSGKLHEVWDYLTEDEQEIVMDAAPVLVGANVPAEWRERIPLIFPEAVGAPFVARHASLWDWVNAIEPGRRPRPFVAIWPRGGGKSTSAELAVADLGCRGKRRYGWYVRGIQKKADETVQNIGLRFESARVAEYYPAHSRRQVTQYGHSLGWSRTRLWTAGGFVVDALGLDTASRGSKVKDQRPDFIVLDDIDALADGPAATAKKIETITKSILPAGSNDCAILFIQNLVIPDGIATQLSDGRADFLADRVVSGPFPAVDGLKWAWEPDAETGARLPVITAGTATWAGQSIADCQAQMRSWGPIAFIKEAQHEVKGRSYGVALAYDDAVNGVDVSDDQIKQMYRKGLVRAFGGIDFQLWRFGFTLWFIDQHGKVLRVDEFFSQRESLSTRAERIHEMVEYAGIPEPSAKVCPIWGDSANPQDIIELNLAFKRLDSKLRVVAVGRDGKMRKASVARINDALARKTLMFRRSVGQEPPHQWMHGANAGSEGTPITGSRLMWEIDHWSFPVPAAGEPQDENPDDDTADGADLIASMRYALMSAWKPAGIPDAGPERATPDDEGDRYDYEERRVRKRKERVLDDLIDVPGRETPEIELPRLHL